ncbi:Histidinol-phosphate aminotransferase [Labilithrix luteola]|uniref:Histidinol-phosphate aminotransferase n=1 Tax=Labilithrix luteola TaxID=1391654 RepID=A0A0K1Q882_9BACT|nr:histidinol-phosphate transaminase [Labilithrix luteola]AKV02021.1 Histidinol-phosphate aminotransferase [Labilithrix luteola]
MKTVVESLAALLRPELAELTAYVPHVVPGIEVKLDANEAPPARSPAIREAVTKALAHVELERYPDPRALRLKAAIEKRTGAPADTLIFGSGSDELIALVVNALAVPRKKGAPAVVLTPTPTFVMYRMTSRCHGIKPVEVPLDRSWDLDVDSTKRAIAMMEPNVVFVASPNNPTGNRMSDDRVRDVVAACGTEQNAAFAIVDEAYVDYAAEGSLRGLRATQPHLGILRTLSKIGLAALRVGWLEADAGLVTEIDKTRQPFNLSATSQAAAAAVLEDDDAWSAVRAEAAAIVKARGELATAIDALEGFSVTPSSANFLWVKTPGPAEPVFAHLAKDGILVRSFHAGGGRLGSQIRITIGNDAENARLLESLRKVPATGLGG